MIWIGIEKDMHVMYSIVLASKEINAYVEILNYAFAFPWVELTKPKAQHSPSWYTSKACML